MKSQTYKPLTLAVVLCLGACSTFQTPDADNQAATTSRAAPGQEEMVVENLVSEAGELGNMDVAGVREAIQPQQIEAPTLEAVEPITPTIPMTANAVVEQAINDLLQNRRALIHIWLERGATYFPMIEKTFQEEGVPDELKYIALGESGLRPAVRSHAGAAGMWQFMPATGRGAGLYIDEWVDERLDPEKSTRAAARHLKYLYELYDGNWHLALAGYNCSYRCIRRAVTRAGGSIESPPSFWEIYQYLPQETRRFVPKFIAAALVVSNPAMYGVRHESVAQPLAYDVVAVKGMLTLEDAAALAGTEVSTLRNLNSSLRKGSLPDRGEPYALKLPLGSHRQFVQAFDNLPPEQKAAPGEYIVRRGDTLDAIARRLGTSVTRLKAFNGLHGHLIYPRQKLLVPGTGVNSEILITSRDAISVEYGEARFRPIKLREEFQLVRQNTEEDGTPIMAVSLTSEEEDSYLVPTVYKVRRGDTLGRISRRFKVQVSEIQQWNSLPGTLIRVGQELRIHTPAPAATPPRGEITTYQVRRGDNLAAIARRFGVTVASLKDWNSLNGDLIYPGQQLVLN